MSSFPHHQAILADFDSFPPADLPVPALAGRSSSSSMQHSEPNTALVARLAPLVSNRCVIGIAITLFACTAVAVACDCSVQLQSLVCYS
jgi:hypothetical protein